MTSSLVGSEMCIRDRPQGVLRGLLGVLSVYDTHWTLALATRSRMVKATCLLYTSDAADDM
eukprot:8531894-Prorocentrum_lima.AAC.1